MPSSSWGTRHLDLGKRMLLRDAKYKTEILEILINDNKNTSIMEQEEASDRIVNSAHINWIKTFWMRQVVSQNPTN